MGLFDTIRARMELHKLEQKYARRDKRTTFYATAQYVDGEYRYGGEPVSVNSTGRSKTSEVVVKVTDVLSKRSSKVW